jgi:hypothetical protein
MIEAFEEINLPAAHVSKVIDCSYKAVRPTIPFILGMVKGEVKYESDVIEEALERYNQLKSQA